MEEKMTNTEVIVSDLTEKLVWEAPLLISLDKGKTEGGFSPATPESTYGTQS